MSKFKVDEFRALSILNERTFCPVHIPPISPVIDSSLCMLLVSYACYAFHL